MLIKEIGKHVKTKSSNFKIKIHQKNLQTDLKIIFINQPYEATKNFSFDLAPTASLNVNKNKNQILWIGYTISTHCAISPLFYSNSKAKRHGIIIFRISWFFLLINKTCKRILMENMKSYYALLDIGSSIPSLNQL